MPGLLLTESANGTNWQHNELPVKVDADKELITERPEKVNDAYLALREQPYAPESDAQPLSMPSF